MFNNNQTVVETINPDGSVTRVTTITQVNGDTNVNTHTFTADEYQIQHIQLRSQIDTLQKQLDTLIAQEAAAALNVAQITSSSAKII